MPGERSASILDLCRSQTTNLTPLQFGNSHGFASTNLGPVSRIPFHRTAFLKPSASIGHRSTRGDEFLARPCVCHRSEDIEFACILVGTDHLYDGSTERGRKDCSSLVTLELGRA